MQYKFGQIMNPDFATEYRTESISNTEVLILVVFSLYMYVKERKTL